jgi:hypothetical protein
MSILLAKIAQIHRAGTPPVTWNPSDKDPAITLSGGNLIATDTGGGAWVTARATLARSAATANHYFEETFTGSNNMVGVINAADSITPAVYVGRTTNGFGYYSSNGQKFNNNAGAAYGSTFVAGDVLGVLLKNGKVYFRKNGVWQNSADPIAETGWAFNGLVGNFMPAGSVFANSETFTGRFSPAAISGSLPSGTSTWGT